MLGLRAPAAIIGAGLPASRGVYEGVVGVTISVVHAASARMLVELRERGIRAIVTETASPLSNAATIARELGIVGVLGVHDATRLIPEGSTVVVDGTAGEVRASRRTAPEIS